MKDLLERASQLSEAKRLLLERELLKKRQNRAPEAVIRPRHGVGPAPLSFTQERLWFLDQLDPGNPAYNLPAAIRLNGNLQVTALEQTLGEIARRHEVLRTTFEAKDGKPEQVISPAVKLVLPLVDLTELPEKAQSAQTYRLANEQAHSSFDLAAGPLWRTTLVRFSRQHHVVLFTMHHIISDGWSIGLFVREVSSIYTALVHHAPHGLPPLPVQYADFAAWQREKLQGETLKNELAYWRQELAGAPPVVELPVDYPRPSTSSYKGSRHHVILPAGLAAMLKALGRSEGATLFMTLLAAFMALLYRYTNQPDIVVGSPVANRNSAEVEPLIGFFVNTLVLRAACDRKESFRAFLKQVARRTMGAYAHQDIPFGKLVEELKPERNLNLTPLFNVTFALNSVPMHRLALPGLSLSLIEIESGTIPFDLSLTVTEQPEGLIVLFEYSSDLFEAATIERMGRHFQTLLGSIAANADEQISSLRLLTNKELSQILFEWNATRRDYPRDACLHQLFEMRAAETPDAVAVIFKDERLTYAELNMRANQVAHYLRRLGAHPEMCVGVCLERSLEMAIGFLGVLKAGCACVPLDPEYPKERLAFMLEDAQVSLLLTSQSLLPALSGLAARAVLIDSDWQAIATESEDNPDDRALSENLAYVIYTSGSTGQPKAAMIPHRYYCNRICWGLKAYDVRSDDRCLLIASFSFDVSVWEFFLPWLAGASLIMARPGGHLDPAYLIDLISREGITIAGFVPQMLQLLLDESEIQKCSCLRHVLCGGEPLTVELQERFFARLDVGLHNLCGPTEASGDAVAWACRRQEFGRRCVPLGRPISNTEIYILDRELQPVPVGVTGEWYISGDGLARGYMNRPDLTALYFIPNPFSTRPGQRMFRSGDLGRYLPDGNIELLGRRDHQVKIRGMRIELEEIEAALETHPAVKQAVVIALQPKPDGLDSGNVAELYQGRVEKLLDEIEELSEEEADLALGQLTALA